MNLDRVLARLHEGMRQRARIVPSRDNGDGTHEVGGGTVTTSRPDYGMLAMQGDVAYELGKESYARGTAPTAQRDWNLHTSPGIYPYLMHGTWSNGNGLGRYYHLHNYCYVPSGGNLTQVAIPYGVVNEGLYMRARYNDAWTDWRPTTGPAMLWRGPYGSSTAEQLPDGSNYEILTGQAAQSIYTVEAPTFGVCITNYTISIIGYEAGDTVRYIFYGSQKVDSGTVYAPYPNYQYRSDRLVNRLRDEANLSYTGYTFDHSFQDTVAVMMQPGATMRPCWVWSGSYGSANPRYYRYRMHSVFLPASSLTWGL